MATASTMTNKENAPLSSHPPSALLSSKLLATTQRSLLEPSIASLLVSPSSYSLPIASHHQQQEKDHTMADATSVGLASWRKGQGFKAWESARLRDPAVRRKADLCQVFFYEHYVDLFSYLSARGQRTVTLRERLVSAKLGEQPALIGEHLKEETRRLRERRTKIGLDSFAIVTQVGQGGYGSVYLARHKATMKVVALKKMRKKTLAKLDEVRHVLVERDILAQAKGDWLVKLCWAFQDVGHVYLAMDFIPGGDFRTLLNNSGVLKEEHAKFYISEMICSVLALHKLGYIHRDLKPENFLIDSTGHIKLTDFGLASGAVNPQQIDRLKARLDEVKSTPSDLIFRSTIEMKSLYATLRMAEARYADSVVGSPDYMAPEVLRGQSYTTSVDFWSLGCILFEFLAGFPPFSGASSEETWMNLKNWKKVLRRPVYDRPEDWVFNVSDEGWEAVTAFIAPKETRVGTLEAVQGLRFFKGVGWEGLRKGAAPFVPSLDSDADAGYFDDFEDEKDMAKYAEVRAKQANVDAVQDAQEEDRGARAAWVGFTYRPPREESNEWRRSQSEEGEEEEGLRTLF